MGRTFWILIGVVGAVLIALILNHDSGSVFGWENQQFATFAFLSVWAVIIAGGAFRTGQPMGDMLKQAVIWIAIILGLMAGYVFRYDLQDFGARLSGGIIPGSPISRQTSQGGTEVTLIRSPNGHFEADATINGKDVRFLVDTGASAVVLSARDARAVGIDIQSLNYSIPTQTANGTGLSARTRIGSLTVGNIKRQSLRVMVAEPGKLSQSLLGQEFLESLSSYEKRGDRLMLRD